MEVGKGLLDELREVLPYVITPLGGLLTVGLEVGTFSSKTMSLCCLRLNDPTTLGKAVAGSSSSPCGPATIRG